MALFHLTKRYQDILEEMRRVLRASGKLITAGSSILPEENPSEGPRWMDRVWGAYYSCLKGEGVADVSNPGPSRKELSRYLDGYYSLETIQDTRLIQDASYSMSAFFFEVENQTDSNTAKIDKAMNARAVSKLRDALRRDFGDGYEGMVEHFKGEWTIKVFSPKPHGHRH
jgi:hypothetical protein